MPGGGGVRHSVVVAPVAVLMMLEQGYLLVLQSHHSLVLSGLLQHTRVGPHLLNEFFEHLSLLASLADCQVVDPGLNHSWALEQGVHVKVLRKEVKNIVR